MKKKSIPDLRDRGIKYSLPPWDEAAIATLSSKHGFPEDFPLAACLDAAWEWFLAYQQIRVPPTGTELKKYFGEVGTRAQMLHEALGKAGGTGLRALLDEDSSLDISAAISQLRQIEIAANLAKRHTGRSSPGHPRDEAFHSLLRDTTQMYWRAFGTNAQTYTSDPYADHEKYSGPLFDFCSDVIDLFNIEKTNLALGKAVEKALKKCRKLE